MSAASAAMAGQETYNYKVIRQFAIVTLVWGIVGMLVGVIIAAQLMFPDLTYGIPWLSYGRLRPLHTNAVIFAFGGSALFATSYYVVHQFTHDITKDGNGKVWVTAPWIIPGSLGYSLPPQSSGAKLAADRLAIG